MVSWSKFPRWIPRRVLYVRGSFERVSAFTAGGICCYSISYHGHSVTLCSHHTSNLGGSLATSIRAIQQDTALVQQWVERNSWSKYRQGLICFCSSRASLVPWRSTFICNWSHFLYFPLCSLSLLSHPQTNTQLVDILSVFLLLEQTACWQHESPVS